ncbi:hypothetical protein BJ742DRAFT_147297 [Cladochytrium replicatum]|nr:hypothetical protein BJ742DRAFT_147297 [Cladochytrium replicatum]
MPPATIHHSAMYSSHHSTSAASDASSTASDSGVGEKTYYARRLSRNLSMPRPASPNMPLPPLNIPAVPSDQGLPTAGSPYTPLTAGASGPAGANAGTVASASVATELANKSRDELVKVNSKLIAELNIKNKIIHDLRVKENWLVAEVGAVKRANIKASNGGKNSPQLNGNGTLIPAHGVTDDYSSLIEEFIAKGGSNGVSPELLDDLKMKVFQTLVHFKKELQRAKQTVEENNNIIRESEAKRQLADEELTYLRQFVATLQPTTTDPTSSPTTSPQSVAAATELQARRLTELEQKYRASQTENANLQSKVALWCRASKRNQEARIQAEAVQRDLESELASTKAQLTRAKEGEEALRKQKDELENEVLPKLQKDLGKMRRESVMARASGAAPAPPSELQTKIAELEGEVADKDAKLEETQKLLEHVQSRIKEFDQTMQEAVNTVDELERENSNLRTESRLMEQKLDEVNVKMKTVTERAGELERSLGKCIEEREGLRVEVERISGEVASVKAEMEKKLRDGSGAMRELESRITNTEARLAAGARELSDLTAELEHVRVERDGAIDALKAISGTANDEGKDAASAAAATVRLLQTELERTAGEVTNLKERLAAEEENAMRSREAHGKMQAKMAEEGVNSKEELGTLRAALQAKDAELTEAKAAVEELGAKVQKLQTELSTLQETARTQGERLNALQTQVAGLQSEREHLLAANEASTFQLEEKANDVELLEARLSNTTTQLSEAEEALHVAKDRLSAREAELGHLEEKVVALELTVEQLRSEWTPPSAESENAEEGETEGDRSAKKKESSSEEDEAEELKSVIRSKQEKIELLEEKLAVTKDAMEALADELRSSKSQLDTIKRRQSSILMPPPGMSLLSPPSTTPMISPQEEESEVVEKLRARVKELESSNDQLVVRLRRAQVDGEANTPTSASAPRSFGELELQELRSENTDLKEEVGSLGRQLADLKERLHEISNLRKRM